MTKYLLSLLLCFSAYAKKGVNEKFLVINLPQDKGEAQKDKLVKQEATLNKILNDRFPLSSQQLKDIQNLKLKEKAILGKFETADKYVSDVVYTDLSPGNDSIPIYLSRGLPLTIILKDIDGNPVNYYDLIDSSSQFVACKPGSCSQNNQGLNKSSPNNIIVLKANAVLGGGILPVFTSRSDFPLSFKVTVMEDPGDSYIDRLVVVINTGEVVEENKLSLNSLDTLTRAINSITPIPGAELVHFNGPIKAWRKGDVMWVRTSYNMVIPPVSNKSSKLSLNGINTYKTHYSRIITVLDNNNGVFRYHEVDSHE